jgi:hypothetical protein
MFMHRPNSTLSAELQMPIVLRVRSVVVTCNFGSVGCHTKCPSNTPSLTTPLWAIFEILAYMFLSLPSLILRTLKEAIFRKTGIINHSGHLTNPSSHVMVMHSTKTLGPTSMNLFWNLSLLMSLHIRLLPSSVLFLSNAPRLPRCATLVNIHDNDISHSLFQAWIIYAQNQQRRDVVIKLIITDSNEYRIHEQLLACPELKQFDSFPSVVPTLEILPSPNNKFSFVVMPRYDTTPRSSPLAHLKWITSRSFVIGGVIAFMFQISVTYRNSLIS